MNRSSLYTLYWKLESFIVPKLQNSQAVYEDIVSQNVNNTLRWLDLGAGHHLLPLWRYEQEKNLVGRVKFIAGLDYDLPSLIKHRTINNRLQADISHLPFNHESFDLVTSNMVFEHLNDPITQLKEIRRVLTSSGKLIFHTPNLYGYATFFARLVPEKLKSKLIYILQGRHDDDVFPAFYRINTTKHIQSIAKECGFKVAKLKMLCSSALFVVIPPLVVLELFWIRLLMKRNLKPLRTNIITILQKT